MKVYAIEDLERLKDELFGKDKLYKGGDQQWHVPAGHIRREKAWELFGVGINTWQRWEREGKITCGQRVPGGPKLYKLQDIHRLLNEYGRLEPPYPDPDRPGVWRVPLSGRDIKRREVMIDAESLPLIEGKSCMWSGADERKGCVSLVCPGESGGTPLRRVILGITDRAINVAHLNDDPFDCRRANLVTKTALQRQYGMRKPRTWRGQPCSSRFKGVFWNQIKERWTAQIHIDGKCRKLGHFRDEIAAAEAYDEAARLWVGEHARLNFPNGVDSWLEAEATRTERPEAA